MLDSSQQFHPSPQYSQRKRNAYFPNKDNKMEIDDSIPYQATDITLTTISNKETIPTKIDEVTEFQFGDECDNNKENCSRFANQTKLKMDDINICTNNDKSNDIILFGEECEHKDDNNDMLNLSKCNRVKYSDLFVKYSEWKNSLLESAVKNINKDGNEYVKEVTPFNCYDVPCKGNCGYQVTKCLDWNLNDIKIPNVPTRKISNKKQKERGVGKQNY